MSNEKTTNSVHYGNKFVVLITFLSLSLLIFYFGKYFVLGTITEVVDYLFETNNRIIGRDIDFWDAVKLSSFPALEIILVFTTWHTWLRLVSDKNQVSIVKIAREFLSYIILILFAGLIFTLLFTMILGDPKNPNLNFATWYAVFVNLFLIMTLLVINKMQN